MKKIYLLMPLCLLGIVPWFFLGGPDYYSLRSYKYLWNFGHIIFFALLVVWSFSVFKRFSNQSVFFQSIVVFVLSVILGIIIESVQYGIGRQVDTDDLSRNVIGALLAVAWFSPSAYLANQKLLYLSRGLLVILVISQLVILLTIVLDEWRIERGLPILSQFDSVSELGRWGIDDDDYLVEVPVLAGQYALRVGLNTDQYSGVSLKYFYRDWHQYNALSISMFNPSDESLTLVVRIHDELHRKGSQAYEDRFNRSVQLQKGWNEIEITMEDIKSAPANRVMDLLTVQAIGIFAMALPEPQVVYIDSLRLIKTAP